jgi:hypothetical protein
MKKTETRLPVHRPTVASRALPSSHPAFAKKPECQLAPCDCGLPTDLPSTIGSKNGVHKFADNSSDNIAYS